MVTVTFDPVAVVNESLGQLGKAPIVSLEDLDTTSVLCKQYFPSLLHTMLREHRWNFAYKRIALAQDPTAPLSGFAYSYALPPECVRVFTLNSSEEVAWKIEQRKLLTDESAATIEYIAYVDDPNIWDGMFRQAYVTLLASRLCGPLTGNDKKMVSLYQLYQLQLSDAKAVDGQEGSVDVYTATALTDDIRDE